jgi:tRNA-dihydrouridine synthase
VAVRPQGHLVGAGAGSSKTLSAFTTSRRHAPCVRLPLTVKTPARPNPNRVTIFEILPGRRNGRRDALALHGRYLAGPRRRRPAGPDGRGQTPPPKIPVIGNGGVCSPPTPWRMLAETGGGRRHDRARAGAIGTRGFSATPPRALAEAENRRPGNH